MAQGCVLQALCVLPGRPPNVRRSAFALVMGLWWACQDLNLGPHPYQQNTGNRCAERYSRRSRPTVEARVMCSLGALQASRIAHIIPPAAHPTSSPPSSSTNALHILPQHPPCTSSALPQQPTPHASPFVVPLPFARTSQIQQTTAGCHRAESGMRWWPGARNRSGPARPAVLDDRTMRTAGTLLAPGGRWKLNRVGLAAILRAGKRGSYPHRTRPTAPPGPVATGRWTPPAPMAHRCQRRQGHQPGRQPPSPVMHTRGLIRPAPEPGPAPCRR
jgi:hypothetical protein